MASAPTGARVTGIIGWRPPALVVMIARIVLLLVALWLLTFIRGGIPIYVYAAAGAISMAAVQFVARDRADLKIWAFYVLGFVACVQLRSLADETGIAIQFAYPIHADEALFFGTVPTIWLQDAFYTVANVGVLEALTILIYLSYFVFPHLVVFAVWQLDRKRFPIYAAGVIATAYIGLMTSVFLPTAPPWLAGQTGELPHVFRVVEDISQNVTPGAYDFAYDVAGPNDVSAMPSLHTALPAVIAAIAWSRARRSLAVAAWLYVAAMGFALVYLGEHYVVDVLAGIAVAVLVTTLITVWLRREGRSRETAASRDPEIASRDAG